jgi:hypothetical protein
MSEEPRVHSQWENHQFFEPKPGAFSQAEAAVSFIGSQSIDRQAVYSGNNLYFSGAVGVPLGGGQYLTLSRDRRVRHQCQSEER